MCLFASSTNLCGACFCTHHTLSDSSVLSGVMELTVRCGSREAGGNNRDLGEYSLPVSSWGETNSVKGKSTGAFRGTEFQGGRNQDLPVEMRRHSENEGSEQRKKIFWELLRTGKQNGEQLNSEPSRDRAAEIRSSFYKNLERVGRIRMRARFFFFLWSLKQHSISRVSLEEHKIVNSNLGLKVRTYLEREIIMYYVSPSIVPGSGSLGL